MAIIDAGGGSSGSSGGGGGGSSSNAEDRLRSALREIRRRSAASSGSDSGGGGGSASQAPRGAQRAVEQTPEPATGGSGTGGGGSGGGGAVSQAPRGTQRAVEQTPEVVGGIESAPRGARRAVRQTPEPAQERGEPGPTGARRAVRRDRRRGGRARTGTRDAATPIDMVDRVLGGLGPERGQEARGTARGPGTGVAVAAGPGAEARGTGDVAADFAGMVFSDGRMGSGVERTVGDIATGAGRIGAVGGDIVLEGEGSPQATDVDERLRGAADVAFDASFGGELADEFSPVGGDEIAISGPHLNISAVTNVRGDVFPAGEPGELDTSVTDRLTRGPGLFGEETERKVLGRAQRAQEFFGVEEETEELLIDAGAPKGVASFVGGVGAVPGDVAALPSTGAFALDLTAETASNLPGTVSKFGPKATALAVLETGGRATESAAEAAAEDPFGFVGQITGEILTGVAIGRGIERGADVARNVRLRGRGPVVDIGDVTSERGVQGDLPRFETGTGEPTDRAVREIRERAADQPSDLQEVTGEESLLLRSESEALPEELEVEAGEFELPGLFASPDLSPLRLSEGESLSLESFKPRLPRLFGGDEQVTVFPGERVEAMPEGASGFGFAVETPEGETITGLGAAEGRRVAEATGGQRVPDPTTTGAQFLTEAAELGTAFVRPTGSRTEELEAIFPPGSAFTETGEFGVRLTSGRIVPGGAFERRGGAGAGDVTDLDALETAGIADEDVIPGASVPGTRIDTREGQPVVPIVVPTSTTGAATDGPAATGGSGGGFTDPSGIFGGDTTPPGATDTEQPTGGTAPPSGGPTTPPTTPPGEPTTPPTTPPTRPPTGPPGVPITPPGGPTPPPPPPPPPVVFDPDDEDDKKKQFGLEFGADFAKKFGYGVEEPLTVAFGDLDDLSDPADIDEGGVTVVDDDLTPEVTGVTGDPPDDDLDDLLRRDTEFDL